MSLDHCLYSSLNGKKVLDENCEGCIKEDYMSCEVLKQKGDPEKVKGYFEIKLYLENRI